MQLASLSDGTTKDMLAQLVNDDSELISLYYGEEVSEEEAEKLTAEIEELYPDMDVDAHMADSRFITMCWR